MVDLFKRMFGKDASPKTKIAPATPAAAAPSMTPAGLAADSLAPSGPSQARTDEARLAARRAQIANDLFELQQIAMAELELRREQDAAAAKAGFEAEDGVGGRVLTV